VPSYGKVRGTAVRQPSAPQLGLGTDDKNRLTGFADVMALDESDMFATSGDYYASARDLLTALTLTNHVLDDASDAAGWLELICEQVLATPSLRDDPAIHAAFTPIALALAEVTL
jgi:hypothetical protein